MQKHFKIAVYGGTNTISAYDRLCELDHDLKARGIPTGVDMARRTITTKNVLIVFITDTPRRVFAECFDEAFGFGDYSTITLTGRNHSHYHGDVLDYILEKHKEAKEQEIHMTGNEYQQLAARTMNKEICPADQAMHALHGMVGEIGELHSIYQKRYQGHPIDREHQKKELGDLLWFIAEYCTANFWSLEDIMQMNVDKLKARYPEGFEAEKSLNRAEGDI